MRGRPILAAAVAIVTGLVVTLAAPASGAKSGSAAVAAAPVLTGSGPAVIHVGEFVADFDRVVLHGENLQADPALTIQIDDGAPPGISFTAPPEFTATAITLHMAGTDAAVGLHAVTVTNPTSGDSARLDGAFVVRPFGGELLTAFPRRLVDTRNGTGFVPVGKLAPESVTPVPVFTSIGSPATSDIHVLTVTVTEPTGPGYVVIYPSSQPPPATSNLNFTTGQTISNLMTLSLGGSGVGTFSIAMHGAAAHVIIDGVASYSVQSFIPVRAGAFVSRTPTRVLDTRAAAAPLGPGSVRHVPLVEPDPHWTAAVVNLTVDGPTAAGYITAYASGADQPETSNVNFAPGDTIANLAIVPIGPDGAIDLFNYAGSTHVIADLLGVYDDGTLPIAGGQYTAVPARRLVDTRSSATPLVGGRPVQLLVAGRAGVPALDAVRPPTAVVLNLTATEPSQSTYVTVAPTAVTGTSNLNVPAGETRANLVTSALNDAGGVIVQSFAGTTHVIADVQGYFS